jgi:predicted enzyme related to lactoylglutathione lyase
MPDSSVRGKFLWHELSTTDTTSAAAFYLKAVGWTTETWDQNPSYVMFAAGGRPMAGLLSLSGEARASKVPPSWLTYVGTPDVEATARQAESLGGKVLKPLVEVPAVGRWIVLEDPQGAVFAIITPSRGPQADGAPGLGDFSWHELASTDPAAALRFYKQLFGWEETQSMDMGPDLGMYHMYSRNGRMLGGIYKKPAKMVGPSNWLPYVLVPDSKTAVAATKKAGGQIVNGPMEVPGGDWIAIGIDPQGGTFAVHSLNPAKASAAATTAAAPKAASKTAKKAVEKAVTKAVKKAAKRPVKKAAKAAARKTAKKAVKKAAKKTAKKTVKRTAKRTAKKAAKTAKRKAATRSASARKRSAKKTRRR